MNTAIHTFMLSAMLLLSFVPTGLAQNQNLSDVVSNIISNPVSLMVFLIQIALGFGIGYFTMKALKYILAVVALLMIGVMLNIWQFGSIEEFLRMLGMDWTNILSTAQSALMVLGVLTVLPLGLGFCLGIFIGVVRR